MTLNLYNVNSGEVLIWSKSEEIATETFVELYDAKIEKIKQVHPDELLYLVSDDDKKTEYREWTLEPGNKKVFRTTTVRKIAKEFE